MLLILKQNLMERTGGCDKIKEFSSYCFLFLILQFYVKSYSKNVVKYYPVS
jgi:hypothetical protein